MRAIGGISDKYVEEFAVVKPVPSVKTGWLKVASWVACLILIGGIVGATIIINRPKEDSKVPNLYICAIEGETYELVEDEEILESWGLPCEITDEMIGEYIGTYSISYSDRSGKVYDYLGFKGDSVLIYEENSHYNYLLYCNPEDRFSKPSAKFFLDKYGLTDNVTGISVDGDVLLEEKDTFIDELLKTTAMNSDEYDRDVFGGYSEEEQVAIRENNKTVEIIIFGEGADKLKLKYEITNGYFEIRTKYYKVTEELKKLLE